MTRAPDDPAAPTAGAGGLVFRPDGTVLLLRRTNGEWAFPKGHVDPGEGPLDTALREIEEEAGVRATVPDPDATWTTTYVNAHGVPRRITWFRCTAPQTATFTPREALFPDGGFLPPDVARERLTFDADRALLDRVLDGTPDAP